MIVAFAGRRIDAPNADPPRFPPVNSERVRADVRAKLETLHAAAMVSSAACGADILALEAAEELGIRRAIVLPFVPERFRKTSVVDRGGDWGQRFDHLTSVAATSGDLHVLGYTSTDDEQAYAATNGAILDLAQKTARESGSTEVTALIAWDKPRDAADLTKQFKEQALTRSIKVIEISTL